MLPNRAFRGMMTYTRVFRLLILLALLAGAAFLPSGQAVYGASIIAMISYVLSGGRDAYNRVRLDHVWALSFALLIGAEGYLDADFLLGFVPQESFERGARYLVTINAVFLLAFNLVRSSRVPPTLELKLHSQPRPYFWSVLLALYLLYLAVYIPVALETLIQGRTALLDAQDQVRGFADLVNGGLIRNIGIILPIVLAYYFLFMRGMPKWRGMLYALLGYSPILLVQLAMGVRSPLLMALMGILAVYSARFPSGRLRLLKLSVLAAGALLMTITLKQIRTWGISHASTITINPENGGRSPFSEGVVEYFTKLVNYFHFEALRNGQEHLAVALFWIPRSVWAEKPEQLEHWFFRAYNGDPVGYSDAHSIAASFAATAFADFGFIGAVVLWALLGLLFAHLNNRFLGWLYGSSGGPKIVWAGILSGLTFYAIRQFNLVIFLAVSLYALYWLFRRMVFARVIEAERPSATPEYSGRPLPVGGD